jgi:hypothetical protein
MSLFRVIGDVMNQELTWPVPGANSLSLERLSYGHIAASIAICGGLPHKASV